MLAGVAKRRRTQLLATSFAQLRLPWLAPAQLRWVASHPTASNLSSQRPRRRSCGRGGQSDGTRQLATSADTYTKPYDATPLPGSEGWSWKTATQSSYTSHPILVDTSMRLRPETIRVQPGILGTSLDLLQTLHTTLRVGRFERAQAIVQRLATTPSVTQEELFYAHTTYLEGSLEALMTHEDGSEPARKRLDDMVNHCDKEIHEHDLAMSARMLVIMTRASLHALTGQARDTAINKYISLASNLSEDEYDEVLYSEAYTDAEFLELEQMSQASIESSPEVVDSAGPVESTEAPQQVFFARPDPMPLEDLPDVQGTNLAGLGLSGVKRNVAALIGVPALPADAPVEAQQHTAMERQRVMEFTTVDVALERWRATDEELQRIGISSAMQSRPVGALMWQWHCALVPLLKEELEECKKGVKQSSGSQQTDDRSFYAPYLELMPIQQLAANVILTTLSAMTSLGDRSDVSIEGSLKLGHVIDSIGRAVEGEANAQHMANEHKKSRFRQQTTKRRKLYISRARDELSQSLAWPKAVRTKLGSMLVTKLVEAAQLPVTREHPRTKEKITQLQPAFLHRIKYIKGKKFGLLASNPALISKLQSEPVGSLLAKRMPMVVEPKPWQGWRDGGYYYTPDTILRTSNRDSGAKEHFQAADKQGHLAQVYDGLNVLSKVPWLVNHDVFKVQLEAWNTGEEIANFAPLDPQLKAPPEPDSGDADARKQWLAELQELENRKAGLHSQRCFQNFQLEMARAMINDTIYFPHSLDFRGRAYPIPPYLNHMGADNARGLLVFAEGRELGQEGLRWLKIHLANVSGYDKASLQEREDYTMAHLEEIRDSVNNPLDGGRWWLKSEDAWQTLAACFELVKALDSPDPTKFVSHLPLHQDGTCNGLQHYAALGGDTVGAAAVNLEPGDRPADLYAQVAAAVNREVDKDAANGDPVALVVQGHISRRVVKQPVMTNVYGVTYFGAKAQVRKQLIPLFPDVKRYDKVNLQAMSEYVATKIFKSLGSMFTGAQSIQSWLGQCAGIISTCLTPEQLKRLVMPDGLESMMRPRDGRGRVAQTRSMTEKSKYQGLFKSTVIWTTPLRLPVVQPYRTSKGLQIKTRLQTISIQEPQVWDPVSRAKQLQAFPPNFIHSLDATHMLLSAINCHKAGITFASIHDSFWTHACDITRMSTVLRDSFVEMHSDDIIGRLREEFNTRYKGCVHQATVAANSTVGKKITKWRLANPKHHSTIQAELALEVERLQLLKSEIPEERQRGKEMITPAALYDAENTELFVAVRHDTIGRIPDKDDLEVSEEEDIVDEKSKQTKPQIRKLYFWKAVEFPSVPEKGDFDVRRLKESKYFFH